MEPIIKVRDLQVVYNIGKPNEYHALRGESLDIYPEEYIILFGPSGCGKSTLLYSIFGVLEPTGGELLVKGENVYQYDAKQMVKFQQSTMGIIYQSFNLIASLTVMDNVALPLIFAGISPAEREKRTMVLLKRFGVDKQAHKLSTNLSGGQQQRIAVARSLVNNPEILLADEPVGNLDSISSDEVMGTLDTVNAKDKKTIILVTHDAKFLPFAHRVYFMKDGGVEREVINPEKKQIKSVKAGTTILTEVEKLARVFPYVTIDDLRVKSIVNYLTQDLSFDQLERLEKQVVKMLEGKIMNDDLLHILTSPFREGGVELERGVAEKMAQKIQGIMDQGQEIRRFRQRLKDKYTSPKQTERIIGLRDKVLGEYPDTPTKAQVKWLDDHIALRVAGMITMEDMRERMQLPEEHLGGGFTSKQARFISWYLEKLIAQGVHLVAEFSHHG
jgi:ABC-type lipoprotein export system ATPase subunit